MKTPDQQPVGISETMARCEKTNEVFSAFGNISKRISELPFALQVRFAILAGGLLMSTMTMNSFAQTTNEQAQTTDTVKVDRHVLFGNETQKLTPEQKEKIGNTAERIYDAATRVGDIVTLDTEHRDEYERAKHGVETVKRVFKIFKKDDN